MFGRGSPPCDRSPSRRRHAFFLGGLRAEFQEVKSQTSQDLPRLSFWDSHSPISIHFVINSYQCKSRAVPESREGKGYHLGKSRHVTLGGHPFLQEQSVSVFCNAPSIPSALSVNSSLQVTGIAV